ncbi:MAG TPA: DUF2914 domain-containing protein [Candidatus Krumholzibacteria bacterium]|nr:DUF2914 domain-containing protein [Candidatus Krumholzibacteria bacterium]
MSRRFRAFEPKILALSLALLVVCALSAVLPGRSSASLKAVGDPQQKPNPETPADSLKQAHGPKVVNAAVCRAVEDRKPVEAGDRFPSDVGSLSCFCRVVHGKGTKIVHAWIHDGQTRARVELEVGSDSWRTWSTKRILPSWTGSWEVKIMTPDGVVLDSVAFTVY